jgi:hypothetical protein
MEKKGKKMQTSADDMMLGILSRSHKDTANRVSSKDTLEIIDVPSKPAKICKWKDIKVKKAYATVPVSEWGSKKFFLYFRSLCGDKDKSLKEVFDSSIGVARQAAFIDSVKQEFLKKTDKVVTKETLKEYIEWFVSTQLDSLVSSSQFTIYCLKYERYISRFLKENDNKQLVVEETKIIDFSNIDKMFDSGGVNFLLSYGLVISFVWLHKKKNLSSVDAKEAIVRFYKDATRSGDAIAAKIRDVTAKFSPYSPDYIDRNLEELLKTCKVERVEFTNKGKKYV